MARVSDEIFDRVNGHQVATKDFMDKQHEFVDPPVRTGQAPAYRELGELARRIRQIRSGGTVERCHAIPHFGSYNNAAHQWGVAQLMHSFWPEDFQRLAAICLFHDVPERWVGDIPSPVMRQVPGVKEGVALVEKVITEDLGLPSEHELDPDDLAKVKACDRIEFLLWCYDQARMGNREVQEGIAEVNRYLRENPPPEPARSFLAHLEKSNGLPARAAGVIRDAVEKIQWSEYK